jgi:hypothetical protein
MDNRLFYILSHKDTPAEIVLTELEWIAFLFVSLALTPESFDYGAAAQALAYGEALRIGKHSHVNYEAERAAFVQALAGLARLPGGIRFGRVWMIAP